MSPPLLDPVEDSARPTRICTYPRIMASCTNPPERSPQSPRPSTNLVSRSPGSVGTTAASKGGAPQHPGWFHNLTAEPDVEIQVGRERIPVRARIAEGEERSRLWARADEVNQGGYTVYQSRTERPIPVVVLEPR